VLKFELSLHPELSCVTEATQEPTEEQIQSLFDKVAPKLRRILQTPQSAYRFVELLMSSLAARGSHEGRVSGSRILHSTSRASLKTSREYRTVA
jgi:hypothetical protein